uniref:Uncharacterized protein n=1 Tax=Arundo donax TaxID=35708 RepID=A0A0A9PUU1_ARUDO
MHETACATPGRSGVCPSVRGQFTIVYCSSYMGFYMAPVCANLI